MRACIGRTRTDLHFHLLPGVDDGPRDLDEALDLARLAVRDGIRIVTCTPHVHAINVASIAERVRELRGALREAGIPLEVAPGGGSHRARG